MRVPSDTASHAQQKCCACRIPPAWQHITAALKKLPVAFERHKRNDQAERQTNRATSQGKQRVKDDSARIRLSGGMPATGLDGDELYIESLGRFLPYDTMLDEHFVALSSAEPGKHEGIGFTIELTPQTGVTEEMQRTLIALAAVPMPVGSTVAITAMASPAVEPRIALWRAARYAGLEELRGEAPEAAEIARQSTNARAALFLEASRNQILPAAPIYVRHFRVWVSVVIRASNPYSAEALASARAVARAMEAILAQAHLFGQLWTAAEWSDTLREILNPQKVRETGAAALAHRPFYALEEMRWQLLDRDTMVDIGMDGILFSGAAGRSPQVARALGVNAIGLSIETYPQKIDLALLSTLLGEPGRGGAQIPCPFLFTSLLEIPDVAAEKARVSAMCLRTRQMMGTPVATLIPHWHEANRDFTLALRSFDADGGVARVLHQMLLLAPAGLKTDCVQAAQALARKASMELLPTSALHAQALMTVLPGAAGPALAADLRRMRRFPRRTVATAVCGSPVMTEWRGTDARPGGNRPMPLLLLTGRKGQLFFVDPFANAHGSYSATVVGKPGSGKSVVMNELAASAFMQGGRVWIIDAGYSYRKLCALLSGNFLEFGEGEASHWDLNPLRLLSTGESDGSDDRELLEMVVKILSALMTASGLSDYAESILSAAVQETLALARRKGQIATLAELRDVLLAWRAPGAGRTAARERTALEMAAMLQPCCPGGPHAKWFDGSGRPVDFSNRFTVLELDGLSAHRRLRGAVLMTLMLMIDREMQRSPRSQTKLVCIDEAWDLMGEGASGRFIESGYRRARKLNGAFVTATQSIADFFLSETAEAAWRCADTRFFLRQDEDSLEALKRDGRMADDPWLREAISSLTTVAGAWSEMVVKVGDHPAAIGRLLLDPYSRVVYSTLPTEVEAVRRWEAAGVPLPEAIAHVAAGEMTPTEP